jgi:hypothetical protein
MIMAGGPAANAADREQDAERERQEQQRERRRPLRIAAVEPLEDVDRRDLRLEREVAGDEDHRAELADRAREREGDAGEQGRQQVREDDAAEDAERARAERRSRLLHLAVELDQHRLHRAHDERQRHEQQRREHTDARERDPVVQRQQRQPRDDGRQGERQVDQDVDEALAGEVVTDERPGERRPQHRVDRHDRAGEHERQLERRRRLRVPDALPPVDAVRGERGERQQDDQGQIAEGEAGAERRPPHRASAGVNRQWIRQGPARSSP